MTILFIVPLFLSTQVDTAWVRRYNGPGNGYDVPYAIAVDNSGNVYVSGYSIGVGSEQDFVTIKYSSDGQVTWIQSYNGPGNGIDVVNDMVLDNAGNIYVAGYSLGAGSDKDMTTIKYYPNGDTAWVRRYNAPANGTDGVDVITLDNAGNVYVAGWVLGPGTGTDFATIKYYPNGDTAWVRTYNGTNNWSDYIYDLAVDNAGNVYVTGWSDGVGSYSDYVTIKYYPNGDTAWVRRYNGPGNSNDSPNAIAVDNAGNVYVSGGCWGGTGTSYDITTIKYYPNGTTAWLKRYNGPGSNADWVWDMTFDNAGYLYIAGGSMGSGTYYDYITIKYDSNGDTIWLRNYNGPGNNNDVINRITVEDDNDVFVTGYSLNTGGNFDFATIKYNSAGVQMWVIRYDGPANDHDYANAIAVDNLGYVYVTGNSIGSGTEYDYTTIKYEDLVGIGENHLPLPIHAEGIEIYPNPACNHFNILLPRYINEAQFKVFNVFGEEVKEFTFKKHGTEYRVPLVGINPGVYFVQVRGESIPKKIVVTK